MGEKPELVWFDQQIEMLHGQSSAASRGASRISLLMAALVLGKLRG
jgi:hypothetical protein